MRRLSRPTPAHSPLIVLALLFLVALAIMTSRFAEPAHARPPDPEGAHSTAWD